MSTEDSTAALKKMLGVTTATSPAPRKTASPKQADGQPKSTSKSSQKKKNLSAKKGKQNPQSKPQKKIENSAGKKKGKNKQGGRLKQSKEPHYAWSAFQTLPDASNLPAPAFSSPSASAKDVIDDSSMDPDKLSVLLAAATVQEGSAEDAPTAPPPPPVDAPRAEDIEAAAIAEAQAKRNALADAVVKKDEEETKSESGVNLAAIAASPPTKKEDFPTQMHSIPAPPPVTPPPQQHVPPPQANPMMVAQNSHQHPYNVQRHQFAPPPGYVTVQVQVPPQLLPGRRMVVASPAGYPVQIVVPEGVPTGAVIPVHVPAPPQFHYSPYHQHPPHTMHPPPHQPPAY